MSRYLLLSIKAIERGSLPISQLLLHSSSRPEATLAINPADVKPITGNFKLGTRYPLTAARLKIKPGETCSERENQTRITFNNSETPHRFRPAPLIKLLFSWGITIEFRRRNIRPPDTLVYGVPLNTFTQCIFTTDDIE